MTQPTTAALDTGDGAREYSHRQILTIMGGLMLGMFLAALDQTIVSTALPTIVGQLGGIDHYSWVVTAYLLTSTASTPLYGKIGDLYGRKITFQAAIVIFLVGSVIAGLSQNMTQLIAFRALQGLGAGGLISLALAIVGDVIPPRQRGRYQGYFGAVFGVSSVVGPLAGGFFTDHASWRWVFYINLPLGLIALVVTSVVLDLPKSTRKAKVDVLGAALLVAGVSAILLFAELGGKSFAWTSPKSLGLVLLGLALLGLFILWESRVAEPILPLRLFKAKVFTVASSLSLIVGFVMFGAIIFLPLYLQIVKGQSATASGLLLIPLLAGLLGTSIGAGQVISRIGRYKPFPVAGTGIAAIGLGLFSLLETSTPQLVVSVYMFVLGAGIGLVMQTLVLAVQNNSARADLGVATSSVTFFRSLGGAFGTAVFGAILTARLDLELPRLLPGGAPGGASSSVIGSPATIRMLPAPVQDGISEAFVRSLQIVFLVAVPIALLAFALSWLLPDQRLRDSNVDRDTPSALPVDQAAGLPSAAGTAPAPAGLTRTSMGVQSEAVPPGRSAPAT